MMETLNDVLDARTIKDRMRDGGLRLAIRKILEDANQRAFELARQPAASYEGWSLQGLGMFRYYLSPTYRLHVWDDRYQVENVSQIHTHTWDLESEVMAGRIIDHVYTQEERYAKGGLPMLRRMLITGTGGCLVSDDSPTPVWLVEGKPLHLPVGAVYARRYDEIHRTEATCAVTLTRRTVRVDDDRAYVFWPDGTEWVSAEPRTALAAEVYAATQRALALPW